MAIGVHLGFLLCVAVATFAQNTTGFAFGLMLLGLTGLLQLAPVETIANVSSLLTLVNAVVLVRRTPGLPGRLLALVLGCSLVGVFAGLKLLNVLGTHERDLLQLLLGATIIVCSLLLLLPAGRSSRLSGWLSFSFFSSLSGVMGGLFSSAGPPLVYQLYRQPLAVQIVRDTLIVVFAVNALLRLMLQASTDHLEVQALYLAMEAAPVVFAMTWFMRRNPPKIGPRVLRAGVFVLLSLTGASLAFRALLNL